MKRERTVCRLTPAGRGGVAVILLSGNGALESLSRFWSRPGENHRTESLSPGKSVEKRPLSFPLDVPLFGWFHFESERDAHEEVVLHVVSDEEVEIHCHGGRRVVAAILQTLTRDGAVETADSKPVWDDMTSDGGENPVTDVEGAAPMTIPDFRSDAMRLLPEARTERTAKIFLDQMNGRPERFAAELLDRFPATGSPNGNLEKLRLDTATAQRLDRILALADVGRSLLHPPRVVFTGPVNAGKSSLLNALVGFDRVIADPSEGTTRDAVAVETVLDGFPILLCDTAGIRRGTNAVEREGIARAAALLKDAELVIAVFDVTAAGEDPLRAFFEEGTALGFFPEFGSAGAGESGLRRRRPKTLTLLHKWDLPANRRNPFWTRYEKETPPDDFLTTSVHDPETITSLQHRIIAPLFPDPPRKGETVPLTRRQFNFFRQFRNRDETRLGDGQNSVDGLHFSEQQ